MAYKVYYLFFCEVFNLKEIGEYLKNARISNGVSIDEAADDLNLSTAQIENIEEGNTKAFKDIFTLKDLIKDYGKYLGVDTNSIVDEFNDFMFERTSKISLDDIKEAKKAIQVDEIEDEKKVFSPYTNIKAPKISKENRIKISIIVLSIVVVLAIFGLIIYKVVNQEKTITTELLGKEVNIYEYTN